MDKSINNTVFLSPEGLMIFNEGKASKMSISVDPASWSGDYGCIAIWDIKDDGTKELKHVEYLEPRNE